MRIDPVAYANENLSPEKSPRYIIEIDFTDEILRLTGNSDTDVPADGNDVEHGTFVVLSSTSQSVDPSQAKSTIGAISFEAVDLSEAITDKIRDKLQNDSIGLRGKTVTFLHGYEPLDYADYQPVVTQQIRRVELQNSKYIFHCEDIQREAKKQIFDEVKTTLAADLTSSATSMTVYDTDAFTRVAHGTSYSDAPSSTVGYLEIRQGNKREVIRYTGTSASTTFTGLTRGVLGTQAQEFTYESGASDNGIVVRQYVYLEMPVLKMIYALLTGVLLGQGGATLPSEWHLGIGTAWVDQAQFASHFDLYDSSDDTAGFIARIEGVERTDGKSFIEKELLMLAGSFMPVQSDGTLGIKRMADIQPDSGYVGVLDSSNVVSYGNLSHDMDSVFNRLEIQWNWNTTYKEFSRVNILEDTDSQSTHGETETKILKFRGLYGSVHSESILDTLFNVLRDRYAGPPLTMSVTCLHSLNRYEAGDVVRVRLPLQDFSSSATLDRSFEIQKVSINWLTGRVTFDLFASSQRATLRTPSASSQLPDSYYSSGLTAGNEINATNFPGNVSSAGGLTTISGDIALTGHDDLNNAGAIYWCQEALTVASGVTVTTGDNVQLRVQGFFTVDGTIDGIAGSTDSTISGYCGAMVEAQWGLNIDTGVPGQDYYKAVSTGMTTPLQRSPTYSLIPYLDVVTDANGIASGLPPDCRGISGAQGGRVYHVDLVSTLATGGAGGSGGAGLAIISRGGAFGASGKIDLSGGAGIKGGTHTSSGKVMHAGCGSPGGPGSCYWLMDGKSVTRPLLAAKFVGKMGAVDLDGSTPALRPSPVPDPQPGGTSQETSSNPGLYPARTDGNPQDDTQVDISQSCQRVQVITGYVAPAADVDTSDDYAAAALAIQNFNNRNDRISDAIDAPLIADDETAVEHVINADGSASVSLEWSWGGTQSEIDGFIVYLRRSDSPTSYTFGTVDEEVTYTVKAYLRHHLFHGLPSDSYLTFGVRAYRVVDSDVDSDQIIYSNITQPSHENEDPYQPASNVAFAGDLTGTINGLPIGDLATADDVSFGSNVLNESAQVVTDLDAINSYILATANVGLNYNSNINISRSDDTPAGFYIAGQTGGPAARTSLIGWNSSAREELLISSGTARPLVVTSAMMFDPNANHVMNIRIRAAAATIVEVMLFGWVVDALEEGIAAFASPATLTGEDPEVSVFDLALSGDYLYGGEKQEINIAVGNTWYDREIIFETGTDTLAAGANNKTVVFFCAGVQRKSGETDTAIRVASLIVRPLSGGAIKGSGAPT